MIELKEGEKARQRRWYYYPDMLTNSLPFKFKTEVQTSLALLVVLASSYYELDYNVHDIVV